VIGFPKRQNPARTATAARPRARSAVLRVAERLPAELAA
jgi:16S rRNA C1402 N4-methylase RsmH